MDKIPTIRAECTEIGLHVEATLDGEIWQTVQLTKYKVRSSPTVMQYSTCIDPAKDRAEYFETLRARGIRFNVAKS